MKKTILALSFALFSGAGDAAVMAKGKIVKIDSTTSSSGTFSIFVEGGGGYPCNGNSHAISLANFPDEKSFERTYSLALTALAVGYDVEVYNNPVSASCPYMNAIRIIKQ